MNDAGKARAAIRKINEARPQYDADGGISDENLDAFLRWRSDLTDMVIDADGGLSLCVDMLRLWRERRREFGLLERGGYDDVQDDRLVLAVLRNLEKLNN